MDRLELLPRPTDQGAAVFSRTFAIGVSSRIADSPIATCAVARSVVDNDLLTSVHRWELAEELRENSYTHPRLTRQNPFYSDAQLQTLDEDGLIRPGAMVDVDDLLASVVIGEHAKQASPGMQWVRDGAWLVPAGWGGATVETSKRTTGRNRGYRSPQRGPWERIEITLRAERPLEIGDLLLINEQPVFVAQLLDGEPIRDDAGQAADLVLSPAMAAAWGIRPERFPPITVSKTSARAASALVVRNVGPYSLISLSPLSRLGQHLTAAQTAWLHQHRLHAVLAELVNLKSGSLAHRQALADLVDAQAGSVLNNLSLMAPESLWSHTAHLFGLGLRAERSMGDHSVAIQLRPADSDEIRQHSSGEVRKPETIHYRTLEYCDDGLFAPNIFGPGEGVRRRRFGHLELAVPIVPMIYRLGEPSLLSRILDLSSDDLKQIFARQVEVIEHAGAFHLAPRQGLEQLLPDSLGTGAVAIREWLTRLPADRFPPGLSNPAEQLVVDAIPVIPPDLRPLVLLDNGNWATSDLNDLYRQVINRNNRLRKLIDLKAPPTILDSEQRELQYAVDALQANHRLPADQAAFREGGEQRLTDLLQLIDQQTQRQKISVDWGGQARLLPDSTLSPGKVLLPRAIFSGLRLDESLPVLLTSPQGEGAWIACHAEAHDESVARLAPSDFAAIVGTVDSPTIEVQVHRPVTEAGRAETQKLLRGEVSQADTRPANNQGSWFEAPTSEERLQQMIEAMASGQIQPLVSPTGLLTGGAGPIAFTDDQPHLELAPNRLLEAPLPPPKLQKKKKPPTLERLAEAAIELRRKTCLFEVQRAQQPPAREQGRLGGDPYLPPDFDWPYFRDQPLPFLGQFPLEPARAAGVLPFEAPPNSMLTIFVGDDLWEFGPCGMRCPVVIHPIDQLTLRPSPQPTERPSPLCKITPRIVDELPSWSELQEILADEFPQLPKALRQPLRQQLSLPTAQEAIKLGGWPAWVQADEYALPLLLQIASNDDAQIMFGDSGSLYILQNEDGSLSCLAQCY